MNGRIEIALCVAIFACIYVMVKADAAEPVPGHNLGAMYTVPRSVLEPYNYVRGPEIVTRDHAWTDRCVMAIDTDALGVERYRYSTAAGPYCK